MITLNGQIRIIDYGMTLTFKSKEDFLSFERPFGTSSF